MRTLYAWGLLAALALPARADIVDNGSLQIGGQGIFGGTLTVQGNAFSVGGATFSVAGGSITFSGQLNAAAAGIRWADGTTSTTASAGSAGATAIYSTTTIASNRTNNTLLGPCIAGSTLTLITTGRPVLAALVARYLTVNTSEYPLVAILRNGEFLGGASPSNGLSTGEPANQSINPCAFSFLDVVAAGTHSYCVAIGAGGGGMATLTAPINFSVSEL